MRTSTPPLPTLGLFDAAGHHLSVTRASAELNVTPSAVSHGIVGFEKSLGIEIFEREAGRLSPTYAPKGGAPARGDSRGQRQ